VGWTFLFLDVPVTNLRDWGSFVETLRFSRNITKAFMCDAVISRWACN
jgi:hypothetical protein